MTTATTPSRILTLVVASLFVITFALPLLPLAAAADDHGVTRFVVEVRAVGRNETGDPWAYITFAWTKSPTHDANTNYSLGTQWPVTLSDGLAFFPEPMPGRPDYWNAPRACWVGCENIFGNAENGTQHILRVLTTKSGSVSGQSCPVTIRAEVGVYSCGTETGAAPIIPNLAYRVLNDKNATHNITVEVRHETAEWCANCPVIAYEYQALMRQGQDGWRTVTPKTINEAIAGLRVVTFELARSYDANDTIGFRARSMDRTPITISTDTSTGERGPWSCTTRNIIGTTASPSTKCGKPFDVLADLNTGPAFPGQATTPILGEHSGKVTAVLGLVVAAFLGFAGWQLAHASGGLVGAFLAAALNYRLDWWPVWPLVAAVLAATAIIVWVLNQRQASTGSE